MPSLFSWNFEIFDGKSPVAVLDLAWLREKGKIDIHGCSYEIGRESVFGGAFFLRKDGVDLACATKPSALTRSFKVTFGQSSYTLKAASPFRRTFRLHQENRVVGTIYPAHLFTRKTTIDLPGDIPLEVRVFLAWLVIVLLKREYDSSGV